MWQIILLIVYPVIISGNIEEFTGTWTPVALYPPVIFLPVCYEMTLTLKADVRCACADGKQTELLEGKIDLAYPNRTTMYPTLVVEDVNEVTGSLNVSCTCGETVFPTRVIIKSVNKNYFVMYRPQNVLKYEPNGAMIFAREAPNYKTVLNVMSSIPDLSKRSGGLMCSSEFKNADLLLKSKLLRNEQLD